MPFITANDGTQLYWRDWGSGAPMLFVSALGCGGSMWDYQFTEFGTRGMRCLSLDRRGHGRSDQSAQGYDFDTFADDLATFIDTLDLKDVTLVSHSISIALCLDAAEALAKDGIDAEIIDLRTLRPLDSAAIIESVKKTNRIVTVEQGWPVCSIGSEIAAIVIDQAFDWLDAPPVRITGKDVPMPYAARLEKLALPSVDDVVAAAKAVCYR